MAETPEERAARWPLYEQYYGPVPQPPDPEMRAEFLAWIRHVSLFRHVPVDMWRASGTGQG